MRYSILGASIQQVRSSGGKDLKEARHSGVVFATLTPEDADRLKALGFIVQGGQKVKADVAPPVVAPPVPVEAIPTYSPQELAWAIGYEELRNVTDPPVYGQGMNLAIIDTGIRETHEQISGRVMYRKNYTTDPMRDGFDHGTGVCSIALVVAPLCNILNYKVLNDEGEGDEEGVVLALDDCIDLQETNPDLAPTVVNLSLGAPDDGNPNNVMRIACRAAIDAGIWLVAAAGNFGPSTLTITSPACERYVFAVGSSKYRPFMVSDFSSRGPTREGLIKPDGILIGEDMVLASSASDTAVLPKSGTSFSSPFASGMIVCYHEATLRIAGLIAFPGEVPEGIFPELIEMLPIDVLMDQYLAGICIKPEGIPAGKDNDYGYGLPFGPLIQQALVPAPAINLSALVTAVMAIGMMGMMMKTMAQ